jgi:hypothetical protein
LRYLSTALEISLEVALRNFSALTQGDIIEIVYNSIVFGMLVMEAQPGGEGISVLDVDLEVDFAAPVGYVEPERPKPAPPSTMASKLKIDLDSTTSTPGSSRPGSSLSGAFAGTTSEKGRSIVSKDGDEWESFKGRGETLSGRRTKGKGVSHRKIEEVPDDSKIIRTEYVPGDLQSNAKTECRSANIGLYRTTQSTLASAYLRLSTYRSESSSSALRLSLTLHRISQ